MDTDDRLYAATFFEKACSVIKNDLVHASSTRRVTNEDNETLCYLSALLAEIRNHLPDDNEGILDCLKEKLCMLTLEQNTLFRTLKPDDPHDFFPCIHAFSGYQITATASYAPRSHPANDARPPSLDPE